MDFKRLGGSDLTALVGGALLALGMFLPWYEAANRRVKIGSFDGPGSFTGWEIHTFMRFLWLAVAVAPFILAYVIVRGHALSWPRGELTSVLSIMVFGLVGYVGIIDRPGEPPSLVSLNFGWFVSMVGIVAMLVGSALRAAQQERPRKPPGVL